MGGVITSKFKKIAAAGFKYTIFNKYIISTWQAYCYKK